MDLHNFLEKLDRLILEILKAELEKQIMSRGSKYIYVNKDLVAEYKDECRGDYLWVN